MPDYSKVEVRRLPPDEDRNQQFIGGSRLCRWRPRPSRGSQIRLKLWHRIPDPVVARELKRLGFVDVSEGEGLEWIGAKTSESLEFCEALKVTDIVEFVESISKEYARSRTR